MAGLTTPFEFESIYLQSFLNTQSNLSTEQVNSTSVRFLTPASNHIVKLHLQQITFIEYYTQSFTLPLCLELSVLGGKLQ